jgi:flavodoxin
MPIFLLSSFRRKTFTMNRQNDTSRRNVTFTFVTHSLFYFCLLFYFFDHSLAGTQSSTEDSETKKRLSIFILYSLDSPKPVAEEKSGNDPDAITHASPRGPNPKYVAEIIAWELREEGKVTVKAFYQLNGLDEILDHHVIVFGSVSKAGDISASTRAIFEELSDPSSTKSKSKRLNKIVSCFITSDNYEGCEQGRDTVIALLETFQVTIVPGLIITEDMEFDDAAQNIRSFSSKIKDAIGQKSPRVE